MVRSTPASAGDVDSIPGSGRSLGEGNHSSILVWEIPWTEEPVGLQSMGSQRIKHELATRQQQQIVTLQSYVGFKFRYLFKQHF